MKSKKTVLVMKSLLAAAAVLSMLVCGIQREGIAGEKGWYSWEQNKGWYSFEGGSSSSSSGDSTKTPGQSPSSGPATVPGTTTPPGSTTPPWQQNTGPNTVQPSTNNMNNPTR